MALVSSGEWLGDDEQRVWRQWLDVTARLPAVLNRGLQEEGGLSLQDFDVLVLLSEHAEERLRVAALAESLQWERSRLSHHVARMARRGLVSREECVDDGRGSWVVLTDQGRAAIEAAAPAHVGLVRYVLFDALESADVAALGEVLGKVAERLDDLQQ